MSLLCLVSLLAAILLAGYQALGQDVRGGQKKAKELRQDQPMTEGAKEMTLTGIIVPANRFARFEKAMTDKRQRARVKADRAAAAKRESYILWTDDGSRVVLPQQRKTSTKGEVYQPYPVINLVYYVDRRVKIRVLAVEVSKGSHKALDVRSILDIEYLPVTSDVPVDSLEQHRDETGPAEEDIR